MRTDTTKFMCYDEVPVIGGDGFFHQSSAKGGDPSSDVQWRFQLSHNPFYEAC